MRCVVDSRDHVLHYMGRMGRFIQYYREQAKYQVSVPLTFHSSIVVPNTAGVEAGAIVDSVEAALRARDPRMLTRQGRTVSFEGGFLRFVDRRNVFLSVRRGTATISATKRDITVEYLLDFGGAYAVSNVVVAAVAALLLPGLARPMIWQRVVIFGALILLAAIAGPWVTITRFSGIVREACIRVGHPAAIDAG